MIDTLISASSHKELYYSEIKILIEMEELLDPSIINTMSPKELKDLLENKIIPSLSEIKHPVAAEEIFGMTVAYPNSFVRSNLITIVKNWLPYHSAIDTIVRLTRDPDDLVCFKAIKICGEEKIELGLYSLKGIIGNASHRMNFGEKPVGFGAAIALNSMTNIFESENVNELQSIERKFEQTGQLQNNYEYAEKIADNYEECLLENQEGGMVLIPGGFFNYGIDPEQVPEKSFDWTDSIPSQKVWLPPYLIYEKPVTNAEYDAFVHDVKLNGHIFCHPNEPENKDHTRNTYWDERFHPEHPVTGIDWYDAYAFARWSGKELPSEFQWEKAARGEDGYIWPWGNSFNGTETHWVNTLFDHEVSSLQEWRKALLQVDETYPKVLVKTTEELTNNISPYGIKGMIGNHWEWTNSDWATRRHFSPGVGKAYSKEFHHSAVLKGGSFSSMIGLLYPSYRGRDAAYCRHNEMGIRCVKNVPINFIRQDLQQPITNRAIY